MRYRLLRLSDVMSPRAVAIGLTLTLGATVFAASPSHAQQGPASEIEELEAQLVNVEATLDDAQAQKDEVLERRDTARTELRVATRQLELDADRLAQLVSDRADPAERRTTVAIESFIHGDPRGSSLIAEMRELTSDATVSRRAELYGAVVEGAIETLAEIDEELRVTRAEVATLLEDRRKAAKDLARAREDLEVVDGSVDELTAQRDEIAGRIEWLEEVAGRPVLTGREGVNPDRPVLVVKIDNVGPAWPQYGINDADIVFEEQVEGGLSRLAAAFHSAIPDTVGPVRSIRTTDIALLANLDRPLFAHSGGNTGSVAMLNASSIVDVGHPAQPSLYRRESGRRAPHNLVTSPADLLAAEQGGRPPALFSYRAPGDSAPASARSAGGVLINYGNTSVEYRWDGAGWLRTQDGRPHFDTDDRQVSPTNVVVQFVDYRQSAADAASPEAVVVGSGDAWAFVDGQVIEGSWSRDSEGDVSSFVDQDGEAMLLNPGNTWVALAPNGGAAVL